MQGTALDIGKAMHEWHEFYILLGTAASTLLGLLFVAASLGEGTLISKKSREMTRLFMSPIVIHFASVLFVCCVGLIPPHRATFFGILIGGCGLFGGAVGAVITSRLFKLWDDHSDHLAYGLVPAISYFLMVAAGIMILSGNDLALDVLATGALALLLVNVRNVWDLTLSMVRRRNRRQR